MPNIGFPELMLILVLALVVFGPKRLPEIGRTIGKSLREFRRASSELRDELKLNLDDDDDDRPSRLPPRIAGGHEGHQEVMPRPEQEAWKGTNGGGPDGPGPRPIP